MEPTTLEKASNLAAEQLKIIKAPAEEKAKAEAKEAAEAKEKSDAEQKKIEGDKLAEVERKAKDDERILGAEDKSLSEPELKRKAELQETKRKKDESPEERIKRVQELSQKRIDEIKSEMLAKENQSSERLKKLEAELAELKRPRIEEDAQARIKREESERTAKYIEEDKNKPREERREMSEEELEDWYLEEPLKATRWVQRNEIRRIEERKKSSEQKPDETAKKLADEFIRNQNKSLSVLMGKYPDVKPTKTKTADMLGKTDEEVDKLMAEESENARLAVKIVNSDPKKYLQSENGPELVMAEIDKRLENVKSKKVILTEEELEAKIKAEAERLRLLDGEGASSSTKGKKIMEKETNKSELRQKQEAIAKKAGIKMEDLDKTIERRRTIPGAGTFEDGDGQ